MSDESSPESIAVELVVDARAELGEGPVWLVEEQILAWVDITSGLLHRFNPLSGEDTTIAVGQDVGAVAPRQQGGLIMAVREGFATLEFASNEVQLRARVGEDRPDTRMNDGSCDVRGRFWAGSLSDQGAPERGRLYRLDPDFTATAMLEGITTSNGIDWNPDNRQMYYIDTRTRGIDLFDFDAEAGSIQNRRRLVTIPEQAGMPDGLTVDADGFIWVALWGGWAVRRYAPDGTLDRTIHVPASQTTSCAFGGADLGDLYITTARVGLSGSPLLDQPHAGGLFRCRPGVVGLPAHSFAG